MENITNMEKGKENTVNTVKIRINDGRQLPVWQRRGISKEALINSIVYDYKNGKTLNELAREYETTPPTIRKYVLKSVGETKTKKDTLVGQRLDRMRQFYELGYLTSYLRGMNQETIALKTGLSELTVRRYLRMFLLVLKNNNNFGININDVSTKPIETLINWSKFEDKLKVIQIPQTNEINIYKYLKYLHMLK